MAGLSAPEIDFFHLKTKPSKKLSERRDIQGVISKINPELLKTAIASASANKSSLGNKSFSVPSPPVLPVYNHFAADQTSNVAATTAPLTIFYNGTVSVFDVSRHQAENIMKIVQGGSSESTDLKPVASPCHQTSPTVDGVLNKDLPLSRKKSLRRFLEKRKERQASVSPYASPSEITFLS